jgi:hypothetical protein
MATNVTEKDKTLNDVIEWCGEQVSGIEKKIPTASDADFLNGERCTLLAVAAYCGIGVCTGMHPECVHCTVRQLEQAQAEGGSQPTDGGNLILDNREEHDQAISDPIAAKYVRPFRGSRELINGIERWCLWLVDVEPAEIRNSAFLRRRVDAVREMRLASKKAPTRAKATTSWLFDENHQPTGRFLCLPKVFSGRREYATCLSLEPNVIVSDLCYTSPDPDGLAFAVIESRMFIVWQAAVGGRLKSDYRFSNTVVWNNLPLPALDDDTRAALIEAGRNVLAARANHPGQSLADLYDPDYMPTDLRAAHLELDKIADVAFGAGKWLKDDDDTRLQVLFKSYTRMTGSSEV